MALNQWVTTCIFVKEDWEEKAIQNSTSHSVFLLPPDPLEDVYLLPCSLELSASPPDHVQSDADGLSHWSACAGRAVISVAFDEQTLPRYSPASTNLEFLSNHIPSVLSEINPLLLSFKYSLHWPEISVDGFLGQAMHTRQGGLLVREASNGEDNVKHLRPGAKSLCELRGRHTRRCQTPRQRQGSQMRSFF